MIKDIDLLEDTIKLIRGSCKDKIVIFCVGTDKLIGDALGPMVGTLISKKTELDIWGRVKVMGTLDNPIHALNIDRHISMIPEGSYVIAIDTSLGNAHNVGSLRLKHTSLKPGSGVGKKLSEVGDMCINGVVGVSSDICNNTNFMSLYAVGYDEVKRLADELINTLEYILQGVFTRLK